MSVRGAEGAGGAGAEAKERRAAGSPRFHFEALVSVGETAGGGFEAESVDVSPDGMRLRTAYLPEIGDKLVCRFDGMGNEIVAEGEVAWRNEEAKGGEFGLRFGSLDQATADAMRAMCMTLGDRPGDEPSPEEPSVPRGSRVRLHIEGLGSPMKARVRESASREVEVGSNLEFLKVGRTLELEDVEKGQKREALIDNVKVDVDPATNVPQLVVTLRYDRASAAPAEGEKKKEKKRDSVAPATRRATSEKAEKSESAPKKKVTEAKAEEAEAKDAEGAESDGDANGFGARAANAGRAVASKVGPAIAGMSAKAKGSLSLVMELVQRKKAERAEAKKASAPRRTTAPPPGGALTSDGRRLVRDESGADEDEIVLPVRNNKRAAAIGGALGLFAVLALFGVTRMLGGKGHAPAASADARPALTAAADAPAAANAPNAPPGTPTANVPFFGATPLSTTELAPAPAPSALASAAPAASGTPNAAPPGDGEDEPGEGATGASGLVKEWGSGSVSHPITLKIKMDGNVEKFSGASGAAGFTITVPGRRATSPSTDLARKDKRLASVNVVNTSKGAEITVQFKDGVPPYLAKAKGDKLEIAIGKEGHSKVAKSKKSKKKGKH
jgi:hypothetical protein